LQRNAVLMFDGSLTENTKWQFIEQFSQLHSLSLYVIRSKNCNFWLCLLLAPASLWWPRTARKHVKCCTQIISFFIFFSVNRLQIITLKPQWNCVCFYPLLQTICGQPEVLTFSIHACTRVILHSHTSACLYLCDILLHISSIDIYVFVWALEHCRISPPHFLTECGKRQLNQGSFVLLCLHCLLFWVVFNLFIFCFFS